MWDVTFMYRKDCIQTVLTFFWVQYLRTKHVYECPCLCLTAMCMKMCQQLALIDNESQKAFDTLCVL